MTRIHRSVRPALATLLALTLLSARAADGEFLRIEQRTEDFAAFCRFVEEEYAYFDRKAVDWKQACAAHASEAADATDRNAYVEVLERTLGELYDHHAHLGTNTPRSYRLVPTHADVLAAWSNGRAIVTRVRAGSAAGRAGLRPGPELVAIDGEPVEAVVARLAPRFLTRPDPAARDWALQVALAGRRDRAVMTLSVRDGVVAREVAFAPAFVDADAPLSHRQVGGVATIRVHNSLGRQELVPAFDRALADMPTARALVLDLRDTPSGGNSSVARGLMGRLVDRTVAYQRHELVAEARGTGIRRIWVEYVAPRGAPFRGPVAVLVGPWTGSMGEGLAIGLDAVRAAPVLGLPMAHLLGANGELVLPHSKTPVRVPTEKLFHVDGTPREDFVPCAPAALPSRSAAADPELAAAIAWAAKAAAARPGTRAAIRIRCDGEARPARLPRTGRAAPQAASSTLAR